MTTSQDPVVELDDEWYISRRIACPPTYPLFEARYATIEEYLKDRYQENQEN